MSAASVASVAATAATAGVVPYWSQYGHMSQKLFGGFGGAQKIGLRHKLGPDTLVTSDLNVATHDSQTRMEYKGKSGRMIQFGLNLHHLGSSAKPSGFVQFLFPHLGGADKRNELGIRMHKAHWRSMPYFGVDFKQQYENVAFETKLGRKPSDVMTKPLSAEVDDYLITQSVAIGDGPFSIGGNIKLLPFTRSIEDYNIGVNYAGEKSGMTIGTKDKMNIVRASMWSDVHENFRAGGFYEYDTVKENSLSGMVGLLHSPSTKLALKVKMQTDGRAGIALDAPSCGKDDNLQFNISATAKLNPEQGTIQQPKVGFGFSIGDFS